MNLTITIDIPEDFKQLCDIFNFDPEDIFQAFANKISFPVFYSQPNSRHRWANFFFLDYLVDTCRNDTTKWEIHKAFMDKMVHSISKSDDKSEEANRTVMKEWHQFILNKRTEDLINKLIDERKN